MSEVNRISTVDNKYINNKTSKSSVSNSNFSSFLGETKDLDDIFNAAAKKYNVSEDLLKAIGKAESNFNAKAVSRCGAQGIMQLMPTTAASLGVTDSFDAEQNIMGGAKYISALVKKYDGNTSLALAAYNAGSGNVAKYGGIPPFEETQNYVKKVMNYMKQDIDTQTTVKSETTTKVITPVYTTPSNVGMGSDTSGDLSQDFDSVFTYDDYLLFLDKFINKSDEEKNKKNETEDNSNYFTSQNINYNIPVMNLINTIN